MYVQCRGLLLCQASSHSDPRFLLYASAHPDMMPLHIYPRTHIHFKLITISVPSDYLAVPIIALRASCGALHCNRSCLWVCLCGCVCLCVCGSVNTITREKNSPRRRPLPGGAWRPKFNQLEMVDHYTLPTNPVWWRSMHAISSYRGNRPTNTQTHKQTDRGDYNTLRRSFASAHCNYGECSVNYCQLTAQVCSLRPMITRQA